MNEPTWIARADVVFVRADGSRTDGTIRISTPETLSEGEARCFYNIHPILKGRAIHGGDTLQALLLAARACAFELALFERDGGRIEYPGEDAGQRWEAAATFGDFFRVPTAG